MKVCGCDYVQKQNKSDSARESRRHCWLIEHYQSDYGDHEDDNDIGVENEKVTKKGGVRQTVYSLAGVVALNGIRVSADVFWFWRKYDFQCENLYLISNSNI